MARCSGEVCEAEQIYDNSCQLGFPGEGIISPAVAGLCETKKEQERKNGRKIKAAGKEGEQESDG